MSPAKDTYWTVGEGTRNEVRIRRCHICGNTMTRPVGARFGPCPYKALHQRAAKAGSK